MFPYRNDNVCGKKLCRRGHVPAGAGTTKCVQMCSSILPAAYEVGGDMSPPYNGVSNRPCAVCDKGTFFYYHLLTDGKLCFILKLSFRTVL